MLARRGLSHQVSTADTRDPRANRLLAASRWPLRAVRLRRAPREPGRWLLLEVAAPRPFSLGVMHVPNRVTGRKYAFLDAVHDVARGWRRGPALLTGDTNSGRIGVDEEAPAFNGREDGWMAALEAARWRDAFRHLHGQTRTYTWYSPNGRNGFRLDEAFVNRALLPRLREARHEWAASSNGDRRREAVSDHAALIVELEA
jgi:exonuclease III